LLKNKTIIVSAVIASMLVVPPASPAPGVKYTHDISFRYIDSDTVRASNLIKKNPEILSQAAAVQDASSSNPQALPAAEKVVLEIAQPTEISRETAEDSGAAEPYSSVTFVDDVAKCKISDPGNEWYSKGFPIRGNEVPYLGQVNIAVVPIDFSNASGNTEPPLKDFKEMLDKTVQWSKFVSGGKMTYEIHMHDDWIRAPKAAEWYRCAQCPHSGPELQSRAESYRQLIKASEQFYDYSKIDFIYFLIPESAVIDHGTQIYGRVGDIPTFAFYGKPSQVWDHVIHEILHDQGFIGHGPANGSDYGVMMNNGRSKATLSWESFLAGWFDQEDIVCIDARDGVDDVIIKINSLDKLGASGGIKSVMIRTGNSTATVIEYRTDGPFSSLLPQQHGVTMYSLDVSKVSHRCDSCGSQEYEDRKNWWNYLRIPGTFDGRSNGNINFTKPGIIATISGVSIQLLDTNTVKLFD
jgi:hypothetical protein